MYLELSLKDRVYNTILNYVYEKSGTKDVKPLSPFYTHIPINILEDGFECEVNMASAYVYAHTQPIPMHVDRYKEESMFNMCIPLYTEDAQKLLVFDQEFKDHGKSWLIENSNHISHKPLTNDDVEKSMSDNNHAKSETLVGIRPADTDILYKTNDHVNMNESVLPHERDFYYGLSGNVWDWKVGNALVFKSSQLHCTGIQNSFKIGCVILMSDIDWINSLL